MWKLVITLGADVEIRLVLMLLFLLFKDFTAREKRLNAAKTL